MVSFSTPIPITSTIRTPPSLSFPSTIICSAEIPLPAGARTQNAAQPLYEEDAGKAKASLEAAAKKWPIAGRAMAIAFTLGRGHVVASGEAGMMTAQVFKEKDKDGRETFVGKTGMSVPGNDDKQYVLNVLHWLSDVLK